MDFHQKDPGILIMYASNRTLTYEAKTGGTGKINRQI